MHGRLAWHSVEYAGAAYPDASTKRFASAVLEASCRCQQEFALSRGNPCDELGIRLNAAGLNYEEREQVGVERLLRTVSGNPLDLLPSKTRVVFTLLCSMAPTEVARALSITKQAVYDHRLRARRILVPLAQAAKAGAALEIYKLCSRCAVYPRVPSQSLCRECRARYMREWRLLSRGRRAASMKEKAEAATTP